MPHQNKTHQRPASKNIEGKGKFKPYFRPRSLNDAEGASKPPLCPKCGSKMRKNGGYRRRKDGVFVVVYRCPNCRVSTVPNKMSQFSVTCLKCGSRMRKNGRYKRKRDGITVTVYYCTNCRRAKVNKPLRGKRCIEGEAILDKMLGPIARINRCPTCGGKLVRNGFANLKNGFKTQTYVCKVCGKSTRLTSVIRRLQRHFHPPCPLCGGETVRNGKHRGQRFKCRRCNKSFRGKPVNPSKKACIGAKNRDSASKALMVLYDAFLLHIFGEKKVSDVIELSLASRKVWFDASYQKLAAFMSSPMPLTYLGWVDDNKIHRCLTDIKEETLHNLVQVSYILAKNVSAGIKPGVPLKTGGVDSSSATLQRSKPSINLRILKAHIHVDLTVGAIKAVDFRKPRFHGEDLGLGDSEYWQIGFLEESIEQGVLPVVRPKGEESSSPILRGLRWLFNRVLRLIYRLRGIVEAFIAKVFPKDNKLKAESETNGRRIILLAALLYNMYTVAEYLDERLRKTIRLSLTKYIEKLAENMRVKGINFYHTLAQQLLSTTKLKAI